MSTLSRPRRMLEEAMGHVVPQRKAHRHPIMSILGLIAVALALVGLLSAMPDIVRYERMRNM